MSGSRANRGRIYSKSNDKMKKSPRKGRGAEPATPRLTWEERELMGLSGSSLNYGMCSNTFSSPSSFNRTNEDDD